MTLPACILGQARVLLLHVFVLLLLLLLILLLAACALLLVQLQPAYASLPKCSRASGCTQLRERPPSKQPTHHQDLSNCQIKPNLCQRTTPSRLLPSQVAPWEGWAYSRLSTNQSDEAEWLHPFCEIWSKAIYLSLYISTE